MVAMPLTVAQVSALQIPPPLPAKPYTLLVRQPLLGALSL
jgi:hypothetical protein